MRKEDLIVGREYWLNESRTSYGTYLGQGQTDNKLLCFSPENNNGAFLESSNVLVGGKKQTVVAFYGAKESWKPKDKNSFPVTRTQMQMIHNIACSTWKSKIEALVAREMGIFGDSGFLNYNEVNEMFMNASPGQSIVLKGIFPDFLERGKNVFVRSFPIEELHDVSTRLFGSPHTFQITRGGTPGDRPDLCGKSFYVREGYHVNLLPGDKGIGTVIEITRD